MQFTRSAGSNPPTPTIPVEITDVLSAATPASVALWLATQPDEDITAQLLDAKDGQFLSLAGLLTPDLGHALLDAITPEAAARLVSAVPVTTAAGLLDMLSDDEASRVIRLLDEPLTENLLRAMPQSHSALLRGLLAWPEESAASWMRPSMIVVGQDAIAEDAIARARQAPDELEEGVFVTDEQTLSGWVSAARLAVGDPGMPLAEVMAPAEKVHQWSAQALADQETVLSCSRRSPDGMVPVLDGERLIGVITHGSVRQIGVEESSEDSALQGGSSPLDGSYRSASPAHIWKARVVWLAVLFIAEMYTGTVLRHYENELEEVVALSFFVPLLIGTGGNLGTQITTTLIRAMSTEGLRLRDLGRVIGKELCAGLLLGLTMGVLGAVRAWTLGVAGPVMATVAVTLVCICIWSSFIASILPMLLNRIGIDPAVVSAPMISTVVDGTGLMIYFTLAKFLVL